MLRFLPRTCGYSTRMSNLAPYGTKTRMRALLRTLVVLALATLVLSIAIHDTAGIVTGIVLILVAAIGGPVARRTGKV